MNPAITTTPYGRVEGSCLDGVVRFLGVPYADPPVGDWRLRSPRPLSPWRGTRDATKPAAASLQTLGGNQVWMNEPIAHQSEDCLYLNVWTPSVSGHSPVLLWLHGGQTRNGHGASPAIDGEALARTGIVVVTINYRLGALGGLAHPALSDPDSGLCANWGLQDKLAALAWVNRCIEAFGGDPDRVTLGGQSSGAANAVLIAQHGLGAGHYRAVIAQSPPLFRPPMFAELDDAAAYTEAFAEHLGVKVNTLRSLQGTEIQRAEHAFAYSPELLASLGRPRTAPVRDGRLLHQWTYDAPTIALPLMAGWTRHEADFWFHLYDGAGQSIAPMKPPQTDDELLARLKVLMAQHYAFEDAPDPASVMAAYQVSGAPALRWRDAYTDLVFRAPILHLLNRQARAGHATWAYEFAHPLAGERPSAPHASDVPFVFGTHRHPHLACKIGDAPSVATLSTAMGQAWSRFVQSGDPSHVGDTRWPAYGTKGAGVLHLSPDQALLVGTGGSQAPTCWPAYA